MYLPFVILLTAGFVVQDFDARFQGLEQDVRFMMRAHQTVGLSISVVEGSRLVYCEGFGYRDLAKRTPVDTETLFQIGSVTKAFTSALVGKLSQDRISVQDRPSRYIPSLRFSSNTMDEIVTIGDLLAHRSGIGNQDLTHVFFPAGSIERHLQRLSRLKPGSQVRERFDYSNMGYAVLGEVTAQTTGRTWEENIRSELFAPLQMKRSTCTLPEFQASQNVALGYSVAGGEAVQVELEDQNESLASGAVSSSAVEMANFVQMLLNRGVFNGQQIVPATYLEAAFSEQTIIRGSFSFDRKFDLIGDAYGYGWFVHQYKGKYRVNHGGNVSGFTAYVCLYPNEKLGIVVLANQGSANALTNAVSDMIANRALELPRKKWEDYAIEVPDAQIPDANLRSRENADDFSRPLKEYFGTYHAEAYGTVFIHGDAEHLLIQFPAFTMLLQQVQEDVFVTRIIEQHHQNTPTLRIGFEATEADEINSFHLSVGATLVPFGRQTQ